MSVNPYFRILDCTRDQALVEDLLVEVIHAYGQDIRYLPRTVIKEDYLYGEDVLSMFDRAPTIEGYVKNVEGFEGEGDIMSRFGLEIRDQITFTISRRRFDQIKSEKLLDQVGYVIQLQSANTNYPGNTHGIILESNTADGYVITQPRPFEGDLIYFPLVRKLFEIKHVEHESIFYQTGRLQTYDLQCELFDYSSERIRTGNTEIDTIESMYSHDILVYQLLQEDGDGILDETGYSILFEHTIETTDSLANNEYIQQQGMDIIDFSERSPFTPGDTW